MSHAPRSIWQAIGRGLAHRCPNCGQGKLYRGYLKVNESCQACDHALGQYRVDDGPAYLTILLVGHLVIAPLLIFPFIWQWPAEIVLPITLLPLSLLILLALPRIKGAFLSVLYWSQASRADIGPQTRG